VQSTLLIRKRIRSLIKLFQSNSFDAIRNEILAMDIMEATKEMIDQMNL